MKNTIHIKLFAPISVSIYTKGQSDKKFAVFVSYHWLTEKGEMVQEIVTWFKEKGMKPLHYKVKVR